MLKFHRDISSYEILSFLANTDADQFVGCRLAQTEELSKLLPQILIFFNFHFYWETVKNWFHNFLPHGSNPYMGSNPYLYAVKSLC